MIQVAVSLLPRFVGKLKSFELMVLADLNAKYFTLYFTGAISLFYFLNESIVIFVFKCMNKSVLRSQFYLAK